MRILERPARRRRGRRPARQRPAGNGRPRRARYVGHLIRGALLAVVVGVVVLLAFMASRAAGPATPRALTARHGSAPAAVARKPTRSSYGLQPDPHQIQVRLKLPLRSGLLFDVHTGQVLWQRDPQQALPIASLTKMMTALVVVAHARPRALVPITREALSYSGSGVGLLPLGKRVPLDALLYGLLLPSGNDAAIALAQYVAGSQSRFIAMMNARAGELGLSCTHFATVSGIVDQSNYSCAPDLADIAHQVLEQRLLAQIVGSRSAVLPFPIKGGKLYLYNNNPLLITGYPGTDGVKTGYTTAAGQCLVATARRGRAWLGVVLLHSGNPADQAQTLLNAGFASLHA